MPYTNIKQHIGGYSLIPQVTQNSITSLGVKDFAYFSIETENVPHIINVLRNELYSNKILAFIREYSTNAQDANIENNCPERPIEVTLPTKLYPMFKVRDFGRGLSYEEIKDTYIKYGKSTKQGTNTQVGVFGLGSKSAFAYVNSFVITSYHNNKQIVCEAHVDETNYGKLNLISISDSDEESGIEISVPIKENDIYDVINTAVDFYKHFNPRPVFKGDTRLMNERLDAYDNRYIAMYGEDWELSRDTSVRYVRNFTSRIYAVMGNIVYGFSQDDIEYKNDYLNKIVYMYNLYINLPIGSVSHTPSRESLQFTHTTKEVLRHKLDSIVSEIKSIIQSEIDKSENYCDAYKIISRHVQNDFINEDNINDYTYRGEKLLPLYIDIHRNINVDRKELFPAHEASIKLYNVYKHRIQKTVDFICLNDDTLVLLNKHDFPKNQTSERIIQAYNLLKNKNDSVYVYIIDFDKSDLQSAEDFLNTTNAKHLNIVDLSTIHVDNVAKRTRNSVQKKSAKVSVFEFDEIRLRWTICKDACDGGYYIPISTQGYPVDIFDCSMHYTYTIAFLKANHIDVPKVYGVIKNQINKLDNTKWCAFEDFLNQSLTNILSNQDTVDLCYDAYYALDIVNWGKLFQISHLITNCELKDLVKDIHDIDSNMMHNLIFVHSGFGKALLERFGIVIPDPVNSKHDRLEKIRKMYPMIDALFDVASCSGDCVIERYGDTIAQYINNVNKLHHIK